MSFKTYDEYKDSGIEWIGEIPIDWETHKIKDFLNFKIGGTPSTSNDKYFEGDNIWVSISDLSNNEGDYIYDSSIKISDEAIKFSNVKKINKGSLLYSFKLSVGLTAFAGCELYTNEAIASFESNNFVDLNFLKYVFKVGFENNAFENIYGAKLFNSDLIKFAKFVMPNDKNLQNKISLFLDKKTSQIDENIAKNKELINLLEEKKAALINQVVTKGLNPNVSMKDSRIEWFDEIPNHWVTVKAKRFTKIETGGTPKRENLSFWDNGTINWITSGEVNQEVINDSINKISIEGLKNSNAHLLPINSVVMALSGQGQTKGRVAVLNISTCCSQSVGAFICDNKNIFYKFLFYYLKSRYSDIRGLVGDNLRDGLSLSIIGNIPILMPPYKEQKNISKFLDREIPKIDESIKKIQENIDLLEEYKSSLIHHVVTGKIDVREEEI